MGSITGMIFTAMLPDESNGDNQIMGINRDIFALHMANDYYKKGINAIGEGNAAVHEKQFWKLCFPISTLAFSLELSLKLFLDTKDINELRKERKGHHLLSLYLKLSSESKEAILNHYKTCRARKYNFFNTAITKVGNETPHPKLGTPEEMIEDALTRNDDPFSDFRYLYQNKKDFLSFDYNIIIQLTHACLAVKANELGIDLKDIFEEGE